MYRLSDFRFKISFLLFIEKFPVYRYWQAFSYLQFFVKLYQLTSFLYTFGGNKHKNKPCINVVLYGCLTLFFNSAVVELFLIYVTRYEKTDHLQDFSKI